MSASSSLECLPSTYTSSISTWSSSPCLDSWLGYNETMALLYGNNAARQVVAGWTLGGLVFMLLFCGLIGTGLSSLCKRPPGMSSDSDDEEDGLTGGGDASPTSPVVVLEDPTGAKVAGEGAVAEHQA